MLHLRHWLVLMLGGCFIVSSGEAQNRTNTLAEVRSTVGRVEARVASAPAWIPAATGAKVPAGTRLRTRANSRAVIRLLDNSMLNLGELSDTVIAAPRKTPPAVARLQLLQGLLFFQDRNRRRELEIDTPTASAVIEGTEFQISVGADGATSIAMIDGQVRLTNRHGAVVLTAGQQGIAEADQPPRRTAKIDALNAVQWILYYPTVLNPEEIQLSATSELTSSLRAYREGNLPGASDAIPPGFEPTNVHERIFLLAVGLVMGGRVDPLELDAHGRNAVAGAVALRWLQASTRGETIQLTDPVSASQWLALSYYHQSHGELKAARNAARKAVSISPDFGFAWSRLAELEFSFGATRRATEAVRRALKFCPKHAEAWAIAGFLDLARDQVAAARRRFDRASELDPMLGNAWLGRGLCAIREGRSAEGLQDFQTATSVEPIRWLFRNYLAKAYLHAADRQDNRATAKRLRELARAELELAKAKDPLDPTPWLYSAIDHRQANRINRAVDEFETAREINDNRGVYRSQSLLDQDRAVSGANLAGAYRDAGLLPAGVQSASRAVDDDYLNHSSHLFLAGIYNESLTDDRRFESAAVTEYLMYNLLVPTGGGLLSRNVSNQEYSRLFVDRQLNLINASEYRGNGAWTQSSTLAGHGNGFSYAADFFYQEDQRFRANEDQRRILASTQYKADLDSRNSLYLQAIYADTTGGDLIQRYDPATADRQIRFEDELEPILLAGWTHQWNEHHRSLLLLGRVRNNSRITNPANPGDLGLLMGGTVFVPGGLGMAFTDSLDQRVSQTVYSIESQQILKFDRLTLVGGALYQDGQFLTDLQRVNPATPAIHPIVRRFDYDFDRRQGYSYAHWRLIDPVLLSAGLTYDELTYPRDFRASLPQGLQASDRRWSPKAGVTWQPDADTLVRAVFSRSLGGVASDQSFRLEPTQLAGFNQTFRSVIPSSLAGDVSAARFELLGMGVNRRLGKRTYGGLELRKIDGRQTRTYSEFGANPATGMISQVELNEAQEYRERALDGYLNHLVGENLSLGLRYQISDAELTFNTPDHAVATSRVRGTLHTFGTQALVYAPSGWFGGIRADWHTQSLRGVRAPREQLWQSSIWLGYRFPRRRAEIQVGILNLNDADYRLHPVNFHPNLPRERTFSTVFRTSF